MAVSRIDEAGLNVTQYGNRNLIINGAMEVAQRGTSTTSVSSTGYYACDRYRAAFTRAEYVCTVSQDTSAPNGFASSYKIATTTVESTLSAGDQVNITQRLEGQDLQRFKKGTADAEQFTVSFWVKSSIATTWSFSLYDADNSRHCSKTYTTNAANTWEYKTITFPADTTGSFDNDNAASLYCRFWLDGGTDYTSGTQQSSSWASYDNTNEQYASTGFMTTASSTWQITGFQLEVGDTATGFEHRSYGDELARCQRYYYQIAGNAKFVGHGFYFSSSEFDVEVNFPVTMRASPTFTSSSSPNDFRIVPWVDDFNAFSGSQYFDGNKMNLWNSSGVSGTKGDAGMVSMRNASTSKVQFDAEL